MVIVDTSQPTARLLFTISEVQTDFTSDLNLVLYSAFTNETFTISLPENTSIHQSRYDEFIMDITLFNDIREGQYQYKVIQVTGNKTLETGLIEIKGNTPAIEFISIEAEEADDDVLVYQP